MTQTTNYNLNLVEGTDVVNPLVQFNPNFSDIDAAMFANKSAVIGTATELTAGTVHTITRNNPDSNYFKWTATSNWTAGDTMILDSTPVSVYLSDGTVPASGAYVINSEVVGLVSGTRVTLLVSGSSIDAQNVSYDNTVSGLSANNVQGAIDEVQGDVAGVQAEIGSTDISAIGDGTITGAISQLNGNVTLTQIFARADQGYDCDTLPIGSMAYLYSNTPNIPSGVGSGAQCFTFGASNTFKAQLVIASSTLYVRHCYNGVWQTWAAIS